MKHQYALGLLLAMSVVPALSAVRAAEPSSVVISEIAWAGSEKSTADEWIEIRNTGAEALDISGWSLTGVGTGGSAIAIPNETLLSAGSPFLIANYSMTDPKTTLITIPDLVTTAISIPNTGLNVALLDSAGATIDSLVDPGAPNFGSSTTFTTMRRDPSSLAWFTEPASTHVSHEAIAATVEPSEQTAVVDPVIADPAVSNPIPTETIVHDPVVTEPTVLDQAATDLIVPDSAGSTSPTNETLVTNPVATEPIITEEPVVIPITENPIIAEAPGIIEVIIDPVIVEPIIVAESPTVPPVVLEEPIAPDLVTTPIEPVVVTESPIVNVPIVAIETTTTVDASSAAPEVIESTPMTPAIPSSTAAVGDVIISELLSSPSTGNDEWVELRNMTNVPLLLDGLTLVDASGKVTNLTGSIDSGTYTLIPNPNGKLNNDDDRVALMNSEVILDSVSYGNDTNPAPKKDVALAFVDGTWIIATPTPATTNAIISSVEPVVSPVSEIPLVSEVPVIETIIPTLSPTLYADTTTLVAAESTTVTTNSNSQSSSSRTPSTRASHVVAAVQNVATADPTPAATSVKTASAGSKTSTATKTTKSTPSTTKKSSTSAKASARSVTIDDIATITDGTKVKLEGVVVATAGLVGKRSFFLDGLEVYQSSGTLADVKIGDRVSITGEVSILSDHRRVNIQEGTTNVIDHTNPVVHDHTTTLPHGSLTRITGTVSARDGNAVLLDTESGMIKLVPGNGVAIAWTDLAGATITATGILKHDDQETLVLRSSDDIVKQQNNETVSAATIAGTTASQSSLLWMTGALLAVSSAGFGAWVWYSRPKARLSKLILHPTNV